MKKNGLKQKLSCPDPEGVDTWQPPRALEWDPIFPGPIKDPQGLCYPIKDNLIHYLQFNI